MEPEDERNDGSPYSNRRNLHDTVGENNQGDGSIESDHDVEWETDSETQQVLSSGGRQSGGHQYFSEATEYDQSQPIGERLERLTHGAGPSRRKRHRILGADQRVSNSYGASEVEADEGSEKTKRDAFTWPEPVVEPGSNRTKARSRLNKNRPQEVPSSRAVGRFREVVTTKRSVSRDPRFEGGGTSSKLNYDIFRKAYGFLESYQNSEIEELKRSLKKEKNQERSGRLQTLLTRLQQERAERSQGDRRQAALRGAKRREQQAVAAGKKPYFLKGSEKKKLLLEQRYEGLKEEGKLSKFMEKKRKKNAAKDHRWVPAKRQDRG